jgi:hemerythrin-like domain-containing protein
MKPTDILTSEHNAIKVMLQVMESACLKLESGEQIDIKHLEQMVQFIREFADKCHHGKEEDLLFPALQEMGIPREGGPVGVMLADHAQGRAYIKNLDEAIGRFAKGDKIAKVDIIENARGYAALLNHHIFKEDNILFPLADRVIPQEKQESLVKEFDKVETEKLAPGRHEQLHKMLDDLRAIYLK